MYVFGKLNDTHDRQSTRGHDQQRGEGPFLEIAPGGDLVNVGRQRLDIERSQQQRRRQFLQAVDED